VPISVTVSIAALNTAPTPGAVNVGNPDGNGVVIGSVTASDVNGDPLTFSKGSDPGKGSVSVATDGAFTYTPNASARQPGTTGSDSFTVNVSDGKAVTAINVNVPVAPLPVSDTLVAGQWLEVNQYLQSTNGRYRLYMQGDGNLVLYDEAQGHKALWATGTNGRAGLHAAMQGDGNLVLYTPSPQAAVWSTKTNGFPGARLVLQSDNNLVVYQGGTALWDRHAGRLNPGGGSGGGSGGSSSSISAKVAAFVNATNNTFVGDGQCVTLVKALLSQVFGVNANGWGNALNYAPQYASSSYPGGIYMRTVAGFTWHSSATGLQDGDILVWGPYTAASGTVIQGASGHIATYYNGKVYDQNDSRHGGPPVTINGWSVYRAGSVGFWSQGYLGYWRKS